MAEDSDRLRELVAQVAAAYFSNSHVGPNDIPTVISQISASLTSVGAARDAMEQVPETPAEVRRATPAQVRKSITQDALISFEDGRPYKTLRRHLAGRGLTPQQYREKWSLPGDYPMVAPSYSAFRAQLAKDSGLGQLRRNRAPAPVAAAESPTPQVAVRRRGPGRKNKGNGASAEPQKGARVGKRGPANGSRARKPADSPATS